MIHIATAFIAGIAIFKIHSFFPVTISVLSFGIILYLLFRCSDRKKVYFIILIFIIALLYGVLRSHDLPEIVLPSEEVHIIGTINNVPEMRDDNLRFSIREAFIESTGIPGIINLTLLQDLVSSNLREYMLLPGDRIYALAKLKKPRSFQNTGVHSFNASKKQICAVGYVKQMKVISRGKGVMAWIHKKRQRLAWIMDNSLSEESASLHRAIVPGLKSGMSAEMRDGFSSTGLAHLLSISGTHFGLLGFIIFTSVREHIKRLPSKILMIMTVTITPTQSAVLITLPILILYAFISGASLPTIRSLVMVIIYMMALFLGRKGQWLNSLSIAAIVILLWQPEALFELSFQLSFLAVLSIGAVMEMRNEKKEQDTDPPLIPPLPRGDTGGSWIIKKAIPKVQTVLLITISAVMGTAPFVVSHFNRFPVISPVTNILITPLICFAVLPLGFFTGFIALLLDMPVMPLSGLTDGLTNFALKLVRAFSQIPYANVPIHSPTIVEIFLYYAALICIFINKNTSSKRFLPVILVLLIYLVRPYMSNANFSVTFLDVGQGESSVVQLPGREIMVIDGGVQRPDMGRKVIAPFLRSKGIRDIDYLVLSHAHPDHYGGLRYIVDNFNIKEVWTNGYITADAKSLLHRMNKSNIMEKVLSRGDILESDNYKISVLHPYEAFYADSPRGYYSNENSTSLVLKIEAENISILFTGDIEEEAERDLLYLDEWLRSDILKVPHHGGRSSSSTAFIQTVNPKTAVVSSGRNNRFHHPHITTLQRYKEAGVQVYRTDMDGAVTINIKNGRYEISTYLDSKLIPVKHWKDEVRNIKLLF